MTAEHLDSDRPASPPQDTANDDAQGRSLEPITDHGDTPGAAVPMKRSHRARGMVLPVDPADAVARTLAFIRGDDTYERSAAIEGLHARLAHLHDADSDEAMRETAAHLPVLEALFLKFGADAVAADSVDHQSKLMKLSMAAHSEYVRTVGLLAGLKHQRKGPGPGVDAVVVVE